MDRDQTTSSALAESPETLGYLNLWQIVRRRKWRVLLGVFTCLILGTAYLVLSGPQYESTAAVLVLKKRLETAPISGPNQDPRQLEDYLATHMQVITSPRVVRQAVTKHKLADLQCFEGKKDVTKAIVDALTVTRDTRKPGVSPSNEILTIGFRGKEPDECSTVLMAVIDSYQDFLKETYRNINAETLDLIARARDVVQKDLDALEAEYQRFRENTPPLWKGKEGITVQQERLFTLDARRSALRSRQAALKATLTAIDGSLKNGRGYAEFLDIAARLPANREVVAPSLLTQPEPWMAGKSARVSLEEELVNLQLQESKLLENYGSDHPDVQAIRKRIETVRGMIAPAAAARGQVPAQSSRVRELVDLRIQLLVRSRRSSRPTRRRQKLRLFTRPETSPTARGSSAASSSMKASLSASRRSTRCGIMAVTTRTFSLRRNEANWRRKESF